MGLTKQKRQIGWADDMIWYQNLYVGRRMSGRKERVIDAIDHGEAPRGAYVILVPEHESSQLEIVSARELCHDYVREHCLMIVGLAQGRTEANRVVESLVRDVYAAQGDADIRAWLSEEHG